MSKQINKTQLNKFRRFIESGKEFLNKKLPKESEDKKYTQAITMSVFREYYDLDQATAFYALTEGSGDNKIDGFYYADTDDELDVLILVQSKYKHTYGETGTFQDDDIKLCIQSSLTILNGGEFTVVNETLKKKIDTYRQKLIDSDIPAISVKLFFATNGIISEAHRNLKEIFEAQNKGVEIFFVDATEFGNQPKVLHGEINVNLKDVADKTDSIFFIEDTQYQGIIASCGIGDLMSFYETTGKNLLLNENVRFLQKNSKINERIKTSFISDPKKFCYLNNGISIVCSLYEMKPTGLQKTKVKMKTPSVVNGGQTLASIYQIYSSQREQYSKNFEDAKIILRIYQVPSTYGIEIAQATNSQNPIKIVDLHSNDSAQLVAQEYFAKYGIGLIIKSGSDTTDYDDVIKNEALMQIYAALYLNDPSKAKMSKSAVFNKYYSQVFNENINDSICKKLLRCYFLGKFVTAFDLIDEVVRKNAFYSIIYLMGQISPNILNEEIPQEELEKDFLDTIVLAQDLINTIIEEKKNLLDTKFSMNNLFKGTEIKDLMDIFVQNKISESLAKP